MDRRDHALLEALKKRGVIVFANGEAIGQAGEGMVGVPICVCCQDRIVDGVVFDGDGSVCVSCLNAIRRALAGLLGTRK